MLPLNNLTLQKKTALLFSAGLVIGLLLLIWLGIQSVNESIDRTLEERLNIARIIAKHLDENLKHVLSHLENSADFNGSLPDEEQFEITAALLRDRFVESGISLHKTFLISADGRTLRAQPEDSGIIGTDTFNQTKVKETLQSGLATVSSLVLSPLIDVPVVLISTPIFDAENRVIGALTVSVDIEQSNIGASSAGITVGETGYTEIVDENGVILNRTKPASPPEPFEKSDHPGRFADLIRQGQATEGVCYRCHETGADLKRQRDILAFAPLSAASWGVAIRQSEDEALAPARQLGQRLLFLGAVLLAGTSLLVWIMVQGIVIPIRSLIAATRKVAAGDFKAVIPLKHRDEIGQLSTAFYTMTQELAKSRDELVLRNEELTALNTIASTVSQSLNLAEVLGNALQQVLEVTRTTAASVLLRSAEGDKLELMSSIGSSNAFDCGEAGSSLARCACHQVLRSGQTLMVNDVSQCPVLNKTGKMGEDVARFVSVPLKSKDKTLGIMNIACSNERVFTDNDFRILDAIGYHMALAIENSVLYEEAKQKEKLRGQLLNSVINAQEDERKRIARELHDEYGQSLTALTTSIDSLEESIMPGQPHLKEKLMNARSLVGHALEELRRLTLALRPSALDDLGLITAIRGYTQRQLEAAGIEVDFETRGMNKRLAPAVETALFRIIQEAANNIARHSEAKHVSIQLIATDGIITASVEDDGKGFDIDAVYKNKIGVQSLGLLGIQERATLLGGTFDITSNIGQGTRLTVQIPFSDSFSESAQHGTN